MPSLRFSIARVPKSITLHAHRARHARRVMIGLAVLLIVLVVASVCIGAYPISPAGLWQAWFTTRGDPVARAVATDIRLPRVLAGLLAGAAFGASGAGMQAVFRNPLADPGLIGVSSGAALGASLAVVVLPALGIASTAIVPLTAFVGALAVVVLVYRFGALGGELVVQWLLLGGIAINAIAGAAIGLLGYLASDAQLRSLTFWSLGSLAGATWQMNLLLVPPVVIGAALLCRHRRALTVLQLGEADAAAIGIHLQTVKRDALLGTALCVGGVVCQTGTIGFIGLVAPHCLRLMCGPDLRRVLPGSMLLGAILTVAADLFARTVAAPADVPIGIVTALIGAPFFLVLLVRGRNR